MLEKLKQSKKTLRIFDEYNHFFHEIYVTNDDGEQ